jgi:hypothetical protein
MMNVMTGEGVVILARIDSNWVLGVLFKSEETLGMALQKCKDVVRLLEDIELPPPPEQTDPIIEVSSEVIVEDSVTDSSADSTPFQSAAASVVEVPEDIPIDGITVEHGCIVHKHTLFSEAISMGTSLNTELVDTLSHLAVDILFMVDEERTLFKIAENLGRQVERVIEVIRYCVSKHIVQVECPKEQESGRREIVELPMFDGDIKKVKKKDRVVIELCDGTKTVHEIADELGILYFNALQSIVPYRGKQVKFIRKDKAREE